MEEALEKWNSMNYSIPDSKNFQRNWDAIYIERIITENFEFIWIYDSVVSMLYERNQVLCFKLSRPKALAIH